MRDKRISLGALVLLLAASGAQAATAPYPAMAPAARYMMDRSQEIALARSAAPPSISSGASMLVLGAHGYEVAAKGKNGFVCLVERSWDSDFDQPEFWNPKIRGPDCLNAAAARTVLPIFLERARWALSGLTRDQMRARSRTSAVANTMPASDAMSFMMSKEGYLSDRGGHWHPHIMFFKAGAMAADWGANLPDSPIQAQEGHPLTTFFILVTHWSDGTQAEMRHHGPAQ